MDDGFDTSHLQYTTTPPPTLPGTIVAPGTTLIQDWDVQNPTNANQLRYFLSAIDKMHDFETAYKAAIPNIQNKHSMSQGNAEKSFNGESNASTKLTASAVTLQQIMDFKSYVKSFAMEGTAPSLTIRSPALDYNCSAPFTMHTMNVVSDFGEYKRLLPPTRDCFISLKGTAAEFDANAGKIRELLNIATPGAYVSKDAFPLGSDTVSKIFRNSDIDPIVPFESYLSQLLDPATETKTIIRDGVRSVIIQALYCVLSGGRRLFIEINIPSSTRIAEIKFGISSVVATAVNGIDWSAPIPINAQTPIPSIQDCVVWMLGKDNAKPLKKTGAKIWNALKTGNLKQNTQAAAMDGYFSIIVANIAGIPGIGPLSNEDKDLIAIASKTNGDQSYKWDQLIADALGYQKSLHGTYKVTVDYYEFLDDVHSKQVNSVFASKSGRSLTTGRSIYTMTIYLKPLSEEAAEAFTAAAAAAQTELNAKIAGLRTENAVAKFDGIRANFVTKLTELLAEFQTRFTGYLPMNEKSRNTNYKYGNELTEYPSMYIANQYYSACQIVLDHLGKIWSLNKAIDKINLAVANDLPTLQLLISAKNAYEDAAAYFIGFAPVKDRLLTTPLTEWTKQGSGIDSVVNSFNHQIGVLSKNMFPISNVVPVKALYGLSKPTIIGWFVKISSELITWKSKNGMQGGARSINKSIKSSVRPDFFNNKLFANPTAHKINKTVVVDGKTVKVMQTTQPTKQFIDIKTQQQAQKHAQQVVINAFSPLCTPDQLDEFKKEIAKVPQLGEMLGSYIAYMGYIDLRDVNDIYDCYELLSYTKYILDEYYSTSDIFYECVFYIVGVLANDYAMSMHANSPDSAFPVHQQALDAIIMDDIVNENHYVNQPGVTYTAPRVPSSRLAKYDGGGKKTSRRNARRTIKKRPNKTNKRTKRN